MELHFNRDQLTTIREVSHLLRGFSRDVFAEARALVVQIQAQRAVRVERDGRRVDDRRSTLSPNFGDHVNEVDGKISPAMFRH
jgi:hypothetical protein